MKQINARVAQKVLDTVDAGLVDGLGNPVPGQMCVEAAVCYALGLPHSDDPKCVSQVLRSLKMNLNDSRWSSPEARARGLRRLAVAQLGSVEQFDETEFVDRLRVVAVRKLLPIAFCAAAALKPEHLVESKINLYRAATECENNTQTSLVTLVYRALEAAAFWDANQSGLGIAHANSTAHTVNNSLNRLCLGDVAVDIACAAAQAARAYSYHKNLPHGRDIVLADFAEDVVQILIQMDAPGCQWLYLTETKTEGKTNE